MWTLLLIAVHVNNPSDQPGRIELDMPDRQACQAAADSMRYWLKFSQFRVQAQCVARS